jgi:hypothetical protein
MTDDDLDDVIDDLEDARVLETCGSDGWRYRHELLREVAAELAPPSVRRGLHGRVADALVRAGGDPDWLATTNGPSGSTSRLPPISRQRRQPAVAAP